MSTPVRSVVQAFAIIRLLTEGQSLTLSEIAQECSISPSSCLGLLRTLTAEGVLTLSVGKRYALSPGWRSVPGRGADRLEQIITRTRPLLGKTARALAAPIGLWCLGAGERLQLVALGESDAATRIHMVEGQRQPIGSGAVGCALAASQGVGHEELARRYAATRWQRPTTFDEYTASVALAAERGWAMDDGRSHAGILSFSAACAAGPPVLCLSASVFAGTLDDAAAAELGEALRQLAAEVDNG